MNILISFFVGSLLVLIIYWIALREYNRGYRDGLRDGKKKEEKPKQNGGGCGWVD